LKDLAVRIFSTSNASHPGVKNLYQGGSFFVGGNIKMARRIPSKLKHYEITPKQTRSIFSNKNWIRILGFHTRNVAHRAHEYIQKIGFEKTNCDGLFIHPLIGPKKTGDYLPEIIMKSYELIVEKHFQDKGVLIAAFQNYPRYSGPREAVFTAICRKNFGCSHFVVGRDHSGIGDFYESNAAKNLFIKLGDIGIEPIFFDEVNYCKECRAHSEFCEHDKNSIIKISGTNAREILNRKELPPEWYMRKEISDYLLKNILDGKGVFTK
jgi:ATP sulfurylase